MHSFSQPALPLSAYGFNYSPYHQYMQSSYGAYAAAMHSPYSGYAQQAQAAASYAPPGGVKGASSGAYPSATTGGGSSGKLE